MKKTDIKKGINLIKEAIDIAKDNVEEILEPYYLIKDKLEQIEEIQYENEIDTGLDFEMVLSDTLRSCIDKSRDIEEISTQFEILVADLESWTEEVSERKAEDIQEKYIDVLNDIRDMFDRDAIECQEELETALNDMIHALDDMII